MKSRTRERTPRRRAAAAPRTDRGKPAGMNSTLLDELTCLARLVAQRDDLHVVADTTETWSFQPMTGIITANARDLRERSREWNLGLLLHEAAHAAVTCYHEILPDAWMRDPLVRVLLNAVEDCRIETWLIERFPGSASWIRGYNETLFADVLQGRLPDGLAPQFLAATIARWMTGQIPSGMDPRALAALRRAMPGIDRALSFLPPLTLDESPGLHEAWKHLPCARIWESNDHGRPPSTFRILSRLSQYAMWATLHEEVWPHLKELREIDRSEGRVDVSWLENLIRHLEKNGFRRPAGNADPRGTVVECHIEGGSRDASRGELDRILDPAGLEPYHQVRAPLQPAIEELARRLMELACRMGRERFRTGYSSGSRLDWRAVQTWEADPRRWDRLWIRPDRPRTPTPCLSILIDLSGSMDGNASLQARKAVILVTEACHRAGIPLEIWTFANACVPVLESDTPLTDDVRGRIASIPNACSGGTAMANALRTIAQRIQELPWNDHFVVVVGDGNPGDGDEMPAALSHLTAHGIEITGIGLGEESRDLSRWFPDAVLGLEPLELGRNLGQRIVERIGRGG